MGGQKADGKRVDQSARFIEAARQAGADETGKSFERAFKKIVKPKKARAKPKLGNRS